MLCFVSRNKWMGVQRQRERDKVWFIGDEKFDWKFEKKKRRRREAQQLITVDFYFIFLFYLGFAYYLPPLSVFLRLLFFLFLPFRAFFFLFLPFCVLFDGCKEKKKSRNERCRRCNVNQKTFFFSFCFFRFLFETSMLSNLVMSQNGMQEKGESKCVRYGLPFLLLNTFLLLLQFSFFFFNLQSLCSFFFSFDRKIYFRTSLSKKREKFGSSTSFQVYYLSRPLFFNFGNSSDCWGSLVSWRPWWRFIVGYRWSSFPCYCVFIIWLCEEEWWFFVGSLFRSHNDNKEMIVDSVLINKFLKFLNQITRNWRWRWRWFFSCCPSFFPF